MQAFQLHVRSSSGSEPLDFQMLPKHNSQHPRSLFGRLQGDGHEGADPREWAAEGAAHLPEDVLLHHAG